ncbi:hypothetical protein HYN43_029355 [Mucilaginibacter celer]|uniref:Uncharacterized protein n=1 Tax=Mucilaginibacter celer TaxID=2305508 RepID=A0A494VU47_9SPHI|nr:hypothetical protein HYN43_029355 [Mucilaginibacter celer]
MKTSPGKQDQTLLLAALVASAMTIGTLSWLCLTRSGKTFVKSRIKDLAALWICRDTGFSHRIIRPVMDEIVD